MSSYQLITTGSAVQTEEVQALLKENGIESYAQTDAASEGLEALVGSAPFGSHIYVSQENYQKAKELLEAYMENKE